MKPFRKHHILKILSLKEDNSLPMDAFLRHYFRENKAVGSKDRKEICETLYGMIRWQGLIDTQCKTPISWEDRLFVYQKFPLPHISSYPPHLRLSFPKFLYNRLRDAYGEEKAARLCLSSNQSAPTTIRVNSLKISREHLFEKWKKEYDISLCKHSKEGISFHKKINFFALPEFKEGLFEIQDEGSQLVAKHIEAKPRDHVLDFCAGSGGKTLAFAPKMEHKGQIYLYDIRPYPLLESKKRLKRAGVQNAQILKEKALKSAALLEKMDWILLDVPCSGTGTLRRNPDMKWKLTEESLMRLINEQRAIFATALKFLRPKGKIVFATCSMLPEENQDQIAYFMEKHQLALDAPPFQSFPKNGEMDGFFCAVLSKMEK